MLKVVVVYQGKTWPLVELARMHGIDRRTLHSRLQRGVTIEQALMDPIRYYPEGVHRHRDPSYKPSTIKLCDRCGNDHLVRPFPHQSVGWVLCQPCRLAATSVLRNFIGRQQ